ncbi:MAG TPA: T9SS type A sorting domain-containing protein [Puia sp.]|jgi:hypothetical protein|nr:T9SS type A sorting domain-containing protein [Puia sp.]
MQELYKFSRAVFCLVLLAATSGPLFAQPQRTQTAFPNTSIDQYINGFYVSLPANYNTSGKNYPLLVFLHGQGEIGDGSPASLPAVLRNGPPMQINQQINNNVDAHFPDPVVVGGQSFEFIVLSPQMIIQPAQNGPEQQMVDDIINYAIAHYRVDASKINLTGLSMGGGIAIEYPGQSADLYGKRLSSLLAIAIASFDAPDRVKEIAKANLPVWLTVNQGDADPYTNTTGYIQQLIALGATPTPLLTVFPVSGHGGWVDTYGAQNTPGVTNNSGLNVYQWMAQYKRVGDNVILDIPGPLPVTWGPYQAVLTEGDAVTVSWSTVLEQNNRYFIVQRSANGQQFSNLDTIPAANQPHSYSYLDVDPLPGAGYYRLVQVDLDGQLSYSGIMQVRTPNGSQLALRLTPNPAPGILYLQLENADRGRLEVSLSDAAGRILHKWAFDKQGTQWTQSIDPGNLPAGTYFITVKGTKTREVRSFIRSNQ